MMQIISSTKALALACVVASISGFSTSSTCTSSPRSILSSTSTSLSSTTFYPQAQTNENTFAADIIDIADDAERNTISFDQTWAPANGIQRHDGFKLAQESMEVGINKDVFAMTSTDVPTGTPVLFVPESLILSANKAVAELRTLGDMTQAEAEVQLAGAESEFRHYYLMLKLLVEIQKGEGSPYYEWLNSLPRYFTNAVSMTEFCLTCLPPLMKKLSQDERDAQERLGKETVRHVPFISEDIKDYPRDLVKWVYQIVYTRAVETEDGDLKIVPMADYFNHGSDYQEVEASYDEAGNYYAYTSYDVPAGSPLRISYADPRNPSHLLARFGFLDENCPATYCKLLPPTVNEDMLDLGYSHDRMLFYNSGEVADEVWDIFLYTHLTMTNTQEQQALMTAHRTGDYNTKLALHEKYYDATSAALLEHVDNFMSDIDKLIKKAETIGVSDPNSHYIRYEHPRLPLIHNHNVFVRQTFQNVRDRYAPGENWRVATRRVVVQECDEVNMECAMAECLLDENGAAISCEGGLDPLPDGTERMKTQQIVAEKTL